MNELRSFTALNGDIALKTTKASVLTCIFEICPYPMSIAKIHVKTLAFVVLSAISPFGAVNDCSSFNIDRIGQPMC